MATIVVADDDQDILEATSDLLRRAGHDVTVVQDASKLLQTLLVSRPRLLLQDCEMPGLDLPALVRDIRGSAELQGLAILLFTGAVDVQTVARSLAVQGFIEKPFEVDHLLRKVERALAGRGGGAPAPSGGTP